MVPNAIVQPYLPGEALSLSALCNQDEVALLACNRQIINIDGAQLRQTGVEVNGAAVHFETMESLARRVVAAIPGLSGFIGVDLIMTTEGPVVLEINPRLTTAYAGISESTDANALDLLMRACRNETLAMQAHLLARKPVTVTPHAHH